MSASEIFSSAAAPAKTNVAFLQYKTFRAKILGRIMMDLF